MGIRVDSEAPEEAGCRYLGKDDWFRGDGGEKPGIKATFWAVVTGHRKILIMDTGHRERQRGEVSPQGDYWREHRFQQSDKPI